MDLRGIGVQVTAIRSGICGPTGWRPYGARSVLPNARKAKTTLFQSLHLDIGDDIPPADVRWSGKAEVFNFRKTLAYLRKSMLVTIIPTVMQNKISVRQLN
ncbi:hypothetical protein [Microvirga flavescens]|uniref:hypothetical protein n=1 Tax=Microvirga flavescens TaxID=2249811 RepID=UPI0018E07605|nr:hypothetical protein [Microvirga flavescens]